LERPESPSHCTSAEELLHLRDGRPGPFGQPHERVVQDLARAESGLTARDHHRRGDVRQVLPQRFVASLRSRRALQDLRRLRDAIGELRREPLQLVLELEFVRCHAHSSERHARRLASPSGPGRELLAQLPSAIPAFEQAGGEGASSAHAWAATVSIAEDSPGAHEHAVHVFVTGATGVVGRRVVPLLVQAGHRVTAIARSGSKRAALERQGAEAVEIELFDAAALRRVLDGQHAVVNLATHMPSSSTRMLLPWSWRENDRVRREGSAALVHASLAAGVGRFIQESFAPVYEDGGDRWIDEKWPMRPARYNRTVLDAERSAERFGASGAVGIVVRFAAFYGSDSRVLHDMVRIIRKGWAPLPGARSAFISSISHDDAATAVVAALGAPAGAYNVADDEPVSRGEWVDSLADALGLAPPKPLPRWLVRLGGSTGELLGRSQRISNAKLRSATGWAPRWRSVREGWRSIAPQLREAAVPRGARAGGAATATPGRAHR
jgi:2-alkyl-3-oxoalkanoate reductase